jgi:hypothetical protein
MVVEVKSEPQFTINNRKYLQEQGKEFSKNHKVFI